MVKQMNLRGEWVDPPFDQVLKLQKIKTMRKLFGHAPDGRRCKECCHFDRVGHRSKTYFKCAWYGNTCGEATDWRANWLACGKFEEA